MGLSTPVADPAQEYSAMSDNVLIIVGDATETVDTLYLVLHLQEDGFESVVDEPEARRYNIVLHEILAEGWDIPPANSKAMLPGPISPSAMPCPRSTPARGAEWPQSPSLARP